MAVRSAIELDLQVMAYSPLVEANPQLLDGTNERSIAAAHGHGMTTTQVALQ